MRVRHDGPMNAPIPFASWEPFVDLSADVVVGGELLCAHPHPTNRPAWRAWYAHVGAVATLAGLTGLCTVNIDTHQILDKRLVQALLGAIEQSPATIDWHIEWTERGSHHYIEAAATILTALRERRADIGLAVDDVGAGQDGLRRIELTAPDLIKIDRHLLVRARDHRMARSIISHVASLGRSIGAQTVCEGVETESDRALARDLGVDWGQGYLWSARPLLRVWP
jgi:EAL domain-containing protein (putative c-di-GMP-specific phosphodiesterase class I)